MGLASSLSFHPTSLIGPESCTRAVIVRAGRIDAARHLSNRMPDVVWSGPSTPLTVHKHPGPASTARLRSAATRNCRRFLLSARWGLYGACHGP
jgi:hypothetical protein